MQPEHLFSDCMPGWRAGCGVVQESTMACELYLSNSQLAHSVLEQYTFRWDSGSLGCDQVPA